jgi:hypothetical protein
MKTVLEFGVRGGQLAEAIILPTQKAGAEMAANLVRVFSNNQANTMTLNGAWSLGAGRIPRKSWQSSTHFVSLSLLDGIMRGPASAKLWKKDN